MRAYVYQADLLCEDCGRKVRDKLTAAGRAPESPRDESTYDSDEFPKGPYAAGGGRADSPSVCRACGDFLENPLTADGVKYVRAMLRMHRLEGTGNGSFLATIADFYADLQVGTVDRDVLRTVYMTPGPGRRYRLETWDCGADVDGRGNYTGRQLLGYELVRLETPPGGTAPIETSIVKGEDFRPSPCISIDGDESLRHLLTFLCHGPCDGDEDVRPEYRAFLETDAEYLSVWTLDEDGDRFEDEDGTPIGDELEDE